MVSAPEEHEVEKRDVVDGVQQGEREESEEEEGEPILIPNLGQEVNEEIRPYFMMFRHPNGFIQCWLLEKPEREELDIGNETDAGNEPDAGMI